MVSSLVGLVELMGVRGMISKLRDVGLVYI